MVPFIRRIALSPFRRDICYMRSNARLTGRAGWQSFAGLPVLPEENNGS